VGLNERLTRVESHLEAISPQINEILKRLEALGTEGRPSHLAIRLKHEHESPPAHQESAPVLELFKDESLGFQKSDPDVPRPTTYSITNPDWEHLRQELMALIPSPETVERISEPGTSWWVIRSAYFEENDISLLPLPLEVLWESHPAAIGKNILWIAMALQQLPPDFDVDTLGLSEPPKVLAEKVIATVTKLVCSDDSVATCLDGLECLLLQGMILANNGKLRSAWLSHRRAVDIAQLIGIHRGVTAAAFRSRVTFLWRYLLTVDREFSLILGVTGALSNTIIDSNQSDPENLTDKPTENTWALWPLTRLVGTVIERNQTFTKVNPAMIEMTLSIDSKLEGLTLPMVASPIGPQTYGDGKDRERPLLVVSHTYWLAYNQLKIWLHLPLLLDSSTGNSHESHRMKCLDACRALIECYHNFRGICGEGYYNRIHDFQAFTAAMTIIIDAVGPHGSKDCSSSDWDLVYGVATTFEILAKDAPAEDVASQGWRVLSTLIAVAMGKDFPQSVVPDEVDIKNEQDRPSRIKLDLPFFGAVYLERRNWGGPKDQKIDSTAQSLPADIPSWMGTTLESGAPSLNTDIMQPFTPGFDFSTGYWAVDTEFTFEAPFLADFEINWSSCDFDLN
jgi:hypothetical protein